MHSATFDELLKLAPNERAELALALWESLNDDDRATELTVSAELEAEIEKRFQQHLADPSSSIPWEEVRGRLTGSR